MSNPTPYIDIIRDGESITVELTDWHITPEDPSSGINSPEIDDIIAAHSASGVIVGLTRAEDKEAASAIWEFLKREREESDTERRVESRNDRRAS